MKEKGPLTTCIRQVLGGVSDAQLNKVKQYMKQFTAHSFADTATGAVLQDAVSSQGKMIRPRLVIMAGSFGKRYAEAEERLYKAAALIEMTHSASLIHDDIVDEAPLRRGKPSVQRRYGKSAAVYAGDFLMSRITYHLMQEGLMQSGMVLAKAVEAMCAGEITQALCRYRADVTLAEYLQNIYGKTVVLFRAACRMGALESGCDESLIRRLENVGEALGYMFQMRDDLLDFLPVTEQIGKASHQDFREGIYTMPVLYACETPQGRKMLRPYMERSVQGCLTGQDIAEMERQVAALGGMERTWQAIREQQKKAERILADLPSHSASPQLLKLVRKLGCL